MDSIPMIVVTGQVARPLLGTDAFQETDIYGITLPIVKHSYVVDGPRDMARIVAEAFHIASTGRPGPVLIDVPKDVALEEFDYVGVKPGSVNLGGYRPTVKGNPRQINAAIQLIAESRRPLLYLGGGVITANAHKEIKQLAELFQIPVTTTLMGIGAFDEHHPLALGMLGIHGTAYANFAVSNCMPDVELLAKAYGIKGIIIRDRSQLKDAIAEMLASNCPVIVDVRVTRDENCYPMVAPGKSNVQMIGLPKQAPKAPAEPIYCSHCGTKNLFNHNFCTECGAKM
jgi:thiamine pyrophosphate-dependent acetolactate synthase large subunit-like protein